MSINCNKSIIKVANPNDFVEFNFNENSKIKTIEKLKKYIDENLNDYILIEKSEYNEKLKEKKNNEMKFKKDINNQDNQNKKLKEIENGKKKIYDTLNEIKGGEKKNEKYEIGTRKFLSPEEITKLNNEIEKYKKTFGPIKNTKFTKLEKINSMNFNLICKKKDNFNTKRSLLGCIGIKNESNSCYMISVIQCLKNYIKFTYNMLKSTENKDNILLLELKDILIQLFARNRGSISILNFKRVFVNECNLFDLYEENDSTIFLMCLLEKLHEKLNKKKNNNSKYDLNYIENLKNDPVKKFDYFKNYNESNNDSIIKDLFYGYKKYHTFCKYCKLNSYNFQIYNILDFPIKDEGKSLSSLSECFEYYLKKRDTNKNLKCKFCKNELLESQISLLTIPSLLIINLKRAGDNQVYYHNITIPFELKMNLLIKNDIEDKNSTYELIGFISHLGDNINGHNYSFCKNMFDNKWYEYNDSYVFEVKNNVPPTDNAFLLFYQKIDGDYDKNLFLSAIHNYALGHFNKNK